MSQIVITNSTALKSGAVPCETNPKTGGLSRTGEIFHGEAVLTIGMLKGAKRHVCEYCAKTFHHLAKTVPGVVWD